MKIIIEKSLLLKAINLVEGVISTRELKSQLSNILFEAKDDLLTLTATDLDIAVKTKVACECLEAGELTLPAKRLALIIKDYKVEKLELVATPSCETAIIDADRKNSFRYALLGLPKSEFPTFKELPEDELSSFPPSLFLEMLQSTSYAAAVEDSRYVFNGIYVISKEKKLTMVATDGKRLAKIEREFPISLNLESGVIVPIKAVKEIQQLLAGTNSASLGIAGNRLYVKSEEGELLCNLVEGTYPDYHQVIPLEFEQKITFSRSELIDAILQSRRMANEQTKLLRFQFETGKLKILGQIAETGEVDGFISCSYEGEPLEMGFNYLYLMEALQEIQEEDLVLGLNQSMTPVVIFNEKDVDFTTVVMPMRI